MAFVKVLKNKAYFKRFQVKLKRRRQGKTDYRARRRLVIQDCNKYNAAKYRFVVRSTNKRIICQIVYATIQGDIVLTSADSTELANFGIPVGFTNYPAAYATGLLCARRALKQKKLDSQFTGIAEATGEEYHVEENMDERRPFKCLLDVGIIRTTIGNRVFGALKGACDGGLHIPHSSRRFPGYQAGEDGAEGVYDAAAHRSRILGGHVAAYMESLKEEDPEKYRSHFSQYIKHKIDPNQLENLYVQAHKKIRENPEKAAPKPKPEIKHIREGCVIKTKNAQYTRHKKIDNETRKQRVAKKLELVAAKMAE